MKAKIYIFLVSLALLFSGVAHSEESNAGIDAKILKYLTLVEFAPAFKHGLQTQKSRQGKNNEFIDGCLALPDEKIILAATPQYRELLTEAELDDLIQFFSSKTGQRVVRQMVSQIGNPIAQVKLNKLEWAEYDKFAASPGGLAYARTVKTTSEFKDRLGFALTTMLSKDE